MECFKELLGCPLSRIADVGSSSPSLTMLAFQMSFWSTLSIYFLVFSDII
uniref:Uncharacterized protein n=1 Tax=Arundo donax TaxID=35708 RepID=A0A0A9F257_ARUDO